MTVLQKQTWRASYCASQKLRFNMYAQGHVYGNCNTIISRPQVQLS